DAPRAHDQLPSFTEATRRLVAAAGAHFEWLELRQDAASQEPDDDVLAHAVAFAASVGKKIALSGLDARRTRFLDALAARAVFAQIHAVGAGCAADADALRIMLGGRANRVQACTADPRPATHTTRAGAHEGGAQSALAQGAAWRAAPGRNRRRSRRSRGAVGGSRSERGVPFRRASRGDDQPRRARRGFRCQRPRNAERARSSARPAG